MKKETSIAIFLGLLLGAVVAFFLIVKTQEKKIESTKTIANNLKITPKVQKSKNMVNFQPLEIKEPEDNSIINKDSVTLKVKAVKNSLIVIQSPLKEIVLKNDKEEFSVDFPLALGENTISLTVYNKQVQTEAQEKDLKIYYLTD